MNRAQGFSGDASVRVPQSLFAAYGVNYSYDEDRILDAASFELQAGQVLGFLGANGSGKSTLLKVASTILPVRSTSEDRSAQVRFQGFDFLASSARWRAQRVAYVGADWGSEFPLTVEEAVLMGRTSHATGLFRAYGDQDRKAAERAMELTHSRSLRLRKIGSLSGGERQRVAIARALAQEARVLLLDETFSQMDPHYQILLARNLKQWAQEHHGALVLVSHDLNWLFQWVDSVLALHLGRVIASGPIAGTLTEELLRKIYPQVEMKLVFEGGRPRIVY